MKVLSRVFYGIKSVLLVALLAYSIFGTSYKVDDIKKLAPAEIQQRGWEIQRYEGYQFGAFACDGGKVWYHVRDVNVENTYYRVAICMWDGELQYYYGEPERLNSIDVSIP
ncbi:hypothetical protein vBValCWD615_9 [Vibrio phage vB_ValC_WD615]|nr:hypothetical protein vBValCWD615_9 [Vibrio phage vB_ValC_WD615]